MRCMKQAVEDGAAIIEDGLGKIRSPKTRAADAVERIVFLMDKEVDHEVIALMMTKRTGISFDENDLHSYYKLHTASNSGVAITKKDTLAIARAQHPNFEHSQSNDTEMPEGTPAWPL